MSTIELRPDVERERLDDVHIQTAERSSRRDALRRSVDVLLISAWLAIVVGLLEGLYWWGRSELFGLLIFQHPGHVWIAAVAQLALFLPIGLVLAAFAWRCRQRDSATLSVTVLSFVGWSNLLLLQPGLQTWAWLLAAAGLTAVTRRVFEKHASQCQRVIRRSLPWLLAAVAILPLWQQSTATKREADRIAALPPASKDKPNVVLIVLDTVRADALDRHGRDSSLAPNLARLAKQGVQFEQAWVNAPWTLPSTASMFTGKLPRELSGDWLSPIGEQHPTLAETMAAKGWATGGFVANTRYCSTETGLAKGFTHYEDYRLSWADFVMSTALGRTIMLSDLPIHCGYLDWPGRKHGHEISNSFLNWVDENNDRPFFAFLNYWDAHDPYIAPLPYRKQWPQTVEDERLMRNWWWTSKQPVTEQQVELLRGAYHDCIRALDAEIGRLIDQLQRRDLLDNTIIIVTSDHGEHFGEHDLFLHGNSLYEPLLHVPLIVSCPARLPQDLRVTQPVALNGLPNTVCDLIGEPHTFPGSSWMPKWSGRGEASPPDLLFSELASQSRFPPCHGRSPICIHGSMRSVRQGNLKYICHSDRTEELYDLQADPEEQHNLVGDSQYAKVLLRMRKHCGR